MEMYVDVDYYIAESLNRVYYKTAVQKLHKTDMQIMNTQNLFLTEFPKRRGYRYSFIDQYKSNKTFVCYNK